MCMILNEAAETLGDTTPGALDALPLLEEHPAVAQARQDTALPGWSALAFAIVAVAVIAASAVWPWGWALPPLQ